MSDSTEDDKLTKIGNYDMKARVIAEKLKGKKDLEVIEWARKTLKFSIRYRRNIYRWKKNPIILKLAKQYAGMIENAKVPDKIKNSYRVLNNKGEDLFDNLVRYIDLLHRYELPVDSNFIKTRFQQIASFSAASENDDHVALANSLYEKYKKLNKIVLDGKLRQEGSGPNSPIEVPRFSPVKSITRQKYLNSFDDYVHFINHKPWPNVYFIREFLVQHCLVDNSVMESYGVDPSFIYFDEMDPSLVFDKKLNMVAVANFDGSHKGTPTFVGPESLPLKNVNTLMPSCNYFTNEAGCMSKSMFRSLLHMFSSRFKTRYPDEQQPLHIIVEESQFHDLMDEEIPENVCVIVIKKDVMELVQRAGTLDESISLRFYIEVLKNLYNTLLCMQHIQSVNGETENSEGFNLITIFKCLNVPKVDALNMLARIWNSFPDEIVVQSIVAVQRSDKEAAVVNGESDKFTRDLSSDANMNLDQYSVKLQNAYDELVSSINELPVVKKSVFKDINNLLNVNHSKLHLAHCLNLRTILDLPVDQDVFYQNVLAESLRRKKEEGEKKEQEVPTTVSTPTQPENECLRGISIKSMLNDDEPETKPYSVSYLLNNSKEEASSDDTESSTDPIMADFQNAVFQLHLQFVNHPNGPFDRFELYRTMSFDEIYKKVVTNLQK